MGLKVFKKQKKFSSLSLSNIIQDKARNETTTAVQRHCTFLFVHHRALPRRYTSVGLICLAAVVFRWFKDTTKLPLHFYLFLRCQESTRQWKMPCPRQVCVPKEEIIWLLRFISTCFKINWKVLQIQCSIEKIFLNSLVTVALSTSKQNMQTNRKQKYSLLQKKRSINIIKPTTNTKKSKSTINFSFTVYHVQDKLVP